MSTTHLLRSIILVRRKQFSLSLGQLKSFFSSHAEHATAHTTRWKKFCVFLPRCFPKLKLLTGAILPVVFAETTVSFLSQDSPKMDIESTLKNADKLYQETDYKKIYTMLMPLKEEQNDEILWRLARATYEIAKFSKNNDEKVKLYEEAYAYVEKALSLNANNFAVHKWMAILLDTVNETRGTKARLSQSEKIKEHIKKATELNPQDATSFYMLGVWCFSFADLPWYQRKIAAVIFTSPPVATYDEALDAFLQAEKVDPNFYSKNLLMLGKTYLKLGNTENAMRYLMQAKNYPIKTEDDKEAHKEAVDILKSIGVES